jgi:DNA-binding NarL/FixJ family response regulator
VTVTIVLADDHQIVREGLSAILRAETDFRIVGEAADGPEALRAVERLRPDILILDLMMPGLSGIEVAQQVGRRAPRTRVVILSMHSDVAYVAEAVRAGAGGYVLKEAGVGDLVRAIREVHAGRDYFSPPLDRESLQATALRDSSADPYASLTVREREVLNLTVEGHTGAEIAARLFISQRTVESHRANLMRKLGVRNQKELIRQAVAHASFVGGPKGNPAKGNPDGKAGTADDVRVASGKNP